jgi:uncharacterized membrane protein YozB (DUF420 family)
MSRAVLMLLWVLVVLEAGATAIALKELIVPGLTDYQIRSSVVDTWEVSAVWTTFVAAFSITVLVGALLVRLRSNNKQLRQVAAAAITSSVAALVLTIAGHAILTHRTESLTGQMFGLFYGLL